ncbi:MAG: NAD(P)H-dependent oxidoreductase [Caldilineaceae bacterium]|nr:NAD(P)H-dependent oxidoreductase [Caldilineaceae bacterium]
MNIIVISCSLHRQSRSYVLANQMVRNLQELGVEAPLYDLRAYSLPFCDAGSSSDHPHTVEIKQAIAAAQTVILAVPIYTFDVNAVTKNLVELMGRAWNQKLVGFLCAAGGRSSYMSVMNIANDLMLDYRCMVIPRFVYALGEDFGDDRQPTMYVAAQPIQERIQQLATTTVALTRALAGVEIA